MICQLKVSAKDIVPIALQTPRFRSGIEQSVERYRTSFTRRKESFVMEEPVRKTSHWSRGGWLCFWWPSCPQTLLLYFLQSSQSKKPPFSLCLSGSYPRESSVFKMSSCGSRHGVIYLSYTDFCTRLQKTHQRALTLLPWSSSCGNKSRFRSP